MDINIKKSSITNSGKQICEASLDFLSDVKKFETIISDINNMPFISSTFKNTINTMPINKLYLILLLPAIISEILTLVSYILEMFDPKKIKILHKDSKELEIPEMNNINK